MAISKKLTGSGFSPLQSTGILGDVDNGPTNAGATAAGATQATAYAIGAVNTSFGTVAAGTGAILPAGLMPGDQYCVVNAGASNLTVYPPVGGTINAGAVNAGVTVNAGTMAFFMTVPKGAAFSGLNFFSK